MRVGKAQGLRRLPRTRPGPHELDALRLGKKAAAQPEAERLHRQLDRYAYGPPAVRFNDADVDQESLRFGRRVA